MSEDRDSVAEPVELISDPQLKANREAENGVRQFRAAMDLVGKFVGNQRDKFQLKQGIITRLHEEALQGIHPLAGTYRNSQVTIGKSKHFPPSHHEVPDLVADMCDYVNKNWEGENALHLAGYVLWRMNWIHPFSDGNGRTSRVTAYLVLSIKLNSILPGTPTIPDQIAKDKQPYYSALEKCDESWKESKIRLSHMEEMLAQMLAQQLLNATQEAAL